MPKDWRMSLGNSRVSDPSPSSWRLTPPSSWTEKGDKARKIDNPYMWPGDYMLNFLRSLLVSVSLTLSDPRSSSGICESLSASNPTLSFFVFHLLTPLLTTLSLLHLPSCPLSAV
jgi:hypothetical protein